MSTNFQSEVSTWVIECLGRDVAQDLTERNHRFLEEVLELVQACGCTSSEAHQLVDYVFARPIGEKVQEVGGVMITLAALAEPHGIDMYYAGKLELARIWKAMDKIRAKQQAKPKHAPLPERWTPPFRYTVLHGEALAKAATQLDLKGYRAEATTVRTMRADLGHPQPVPQPSEATFALSWGASKYTQIMLGSGESYRQAALDGYRWGFADAIAASYNPSPKGDRP